MKSTVGFRKGLAQVRRDWRGQRFDQAIAEVDRLLENYSDNPKLLIMRSNLICLQHREGDVPTLEDAKNDLMRAIAFDEDSTEALIDLGYYFYTYEDDSKKAAKHFEKAVHLSVDFFTQALVGHAEALSELGQDLRARDAIMEACGLIAHYGDFVRDDVRERIKNLLESSLETESALKNGST